MRAMNAAEANAVFGGAGSAVDVMAVDPTVYLADPDLYPQCPGTATLPIEAEIWPGLSVD
jgi:hypothetical protein